MRASLPLPLPLRGTRCALFCAVPSSQFRRVMMIFHSTSSAWTLSTFMICGNHQFFFLKRLKSQESCSLKIWKAWDGMGGMGRGVAAGEQLSLVLPLRSHRDGCDSVSHGFHMLGMVSNCFPQILKRQSHSMTVFTAKNNDTNTVSERGCMTNRWISPC